MDKTVLDEVVQSALRKAYRWQPPCHWDSRQWREELVGVAYLAVTLNAVKGLKRCFAPLA